MKRNSILTLRKIERRRGTVDVSRGGSHVAVLYFRREKSSFRFFLKKEEEYDLVNDFLW